MADPNMQNLVKQQQMAQQITQIPDNVNWRNPAYRQKVVSRIDEAMRMSGNPITKSSREMESHVFQKAKSREEYLALVARLIIHVRERSKHSRPPKRPKRNIIDVIDISQDDCSAMLQVLGDDELEMGHNSNDGTMHAPDVASLSTNVAPAKSGSFHSTSPNVASLSSLSQNVASTSASGSHNAPDLRSPDTQALPNQSAPFPNTELPSAIMDTNPTTICPQLFPNPVQKTPDTTTLSQCAHHHNIPENIGVSPIHSDTGPPFHKSSSAPIIIQPEGYHNQGASTLSSIPHAVLPPSSDVLFYSQMELVQLQIEHAKKEHAAKMTLIEKRIELADLMKKRVGEGKHVCVDMGAENTD